MEKSNRFISNINNVAELDAEEKAKLSEVAKKFVFRSNDYYQSLIDWSDPNDPIKNLIVPNVDEVLNWGSIDASDEKAFQPVQGLEHKYQSTALLLCNDVCAGYCRYCFRKRLFQEDNNEVSKDVSPGIAYIHEHPEINNVLLTGGDPLVISTRRLREIFKSLSGIKHINSIRIGTKVPAFNPFRIIEDPDLLAMIREYGANQHIYFVVHFNLTRELTPLAVKSLKLLMESGATLLNQTPIIHGVNDTVESLRNLFIRLSDIGVRPYYVFGCRPTEGNKPFAVTIERAFSIYQKARIGISGLQGTSRFVLSDKTGKIEVVGMTDDYMVFRNHSMVKTEENGKVLLAKRNADAYWFNDFEFVSGKPEMTEPLMAEPAQT